jgi:hypothetical protein
VSGKDRTSVLWTTALNNCDGGMWSNATKHCEALISQDWTKLMGNFSINDIPPFIINLEESDSDSDFLDDDDSLSDIQESDTSASDIDEVITISINVDSDETDEAVDSFCDRFCNFLVH